MDYQFPNHYKAIRETLNSPDAVHREIFTCWTTREFMVSKTTVNIHWRCAIYVPRCLLISLQFIGFQITRITYGQLHLQETVIAPNPTRELTQSYECLCKSDYINRNN